MLTSVGRLLSLPFAAFMRLLRSSAHMHPVIFSFCPLEEHLAVPAERRY